MYDQTPRSDISPATDPHDGKAPESLPPEGGTPEGTVPAPRGIVQDLQSRYPGLAGHDYAEGAPPPMGLALTALVIGIVSFLEASVPVIGLFSFLAGPLAIVFGVVALRKKQKKAMAIAGIVLGAAGMVIAGIVTVMVAYFANQVVGTHTVRYVVTSDEPAVVAYFNGSETVEEEITGDWQKDVSFTGLPYAAVSVESTGTATLGCEVSMDGSSASTNTGTGQVSCVTGNMQFWQKMPGQQ
ncbi:hypothetical protein NCCP1664_26490 [Zafaria cholistanensis]|uniref:DUF4190 domain-containing protein n=1 Tax=Zafaria cholistanensis TaxID=1682741 RepID=A0A5A7NTE9_9MICC|nr:hypothetical protein [Zafaria cholistanensis]GER24154.1 hypothetical protein NCCP1664_26490 [Zafaria cholistanensis]